MHAPLSNVEWVERDGVSYWGVPADPETGGRPLKPWSNAIITSDGRRSICGTERWYKGVGDGGAMGIDDFGVGSRAEMEQVGRCCQPFTSHDDRQPHFVVSGE